MRAFVITIKGNLRSEAGASILSQSHEAVGSPFDLQRFDASTPDTVDHEMAERGIEWTYPWDGYKEMAGLRLHRYVTHNRKARLACFMSHYRLWELAAKGGSLVILEDDALFIKRPDIAALDRDDSWAIGINDPRGATRLPDVYHAKVQAQEEAICEAPWVDEVEVPQGLAGASAYMMSCAAAEMAIGAVRAFGAWPNDAILCKQLVPMLGQTKTYYTTIQGTPTSL